MHKIMIRITNLVLVSLTCTFLAACGPDENKDTASYPPSKMSQNADGKLNSWAKDLVKEENCDPAIANALSAYEAHYGECKMPTLVDTCGEQNFKDGVELIDEVYGAEMAGRNPWVISCGRSQDIKATLSAICQTRMNMNAEQCACVANNTVSQIEDQELLRWYATNEAGDIRWSEGKYAEWSAAGQPGNRIDELYETRSFFFGQMEACSN